MRKSGGGKPTYDVGYGRPPADHQFRPGQSGNPKGRPKAKPTMQEIFDRTASQLVTLTKGNVKIRITKFEAAIGRLFQRAIEGDIAALKVVLSVCERHHMSEAEDLAGDDASLDLDDETLARMLARFEHLRPGRSRK